MSYLDKIMLAISSGQLTADFYSATVSHDDDCPKLSGGKCACDADVEIAKAGSARKIGRNEPCPCGSGQKYKRCCGMVN